MSKSHRFLLCAVMATAGTLLAVPISAQFEVAPDHFSEGSTDQSGPPSLTEVKDQIAARHRELEGYYAALQRQSDAVEQARELAAGSGAVGDAACIYIDEYLEEQRALEALTRQLNPRIRMAKAAISKLENQLARTARSLSTGHGSHGN